MFRRVRAVRSHGLVSGTVACGSIAHSVFLRTDAALVTLSGAAVCRLMRGLETNRDCDMRRLMLLRHAKTEHDAPSGRDQERRLDNRGRHDAAEIGGWIGHHPPFPDLALVSPAIRAHQTWEIAWEAMRDLVPQPQVELMPELYGADPAE